MGNVSTKESGPGQRRGAHSFTLRQVISEGPHGKVQVVEHTPSHRQYALRRIGKQQCVDTHRTLRVLRERDMLEELDHPFITNLRFSFQDTYAVYVATDLMGGGRLCDQLKGGQRRVVGEAVVRVWAAELASALQYLHTEHFIVHGRVDTRSVWVDMKGHVALGSFGGAHRMTDNNNSYVEPSGGEGSPSLVPGADGYAGDWWGLGAVMFECLFGREPFRHDSRIEQARMAREDDVVFPVASDLRVTMDCMSAIRGLLHRHARKRLGHGPRGFERLQQHPFFATFDWAELDSRDSTCVPFVPRNMYASSSASSSSSQSSSNSPQSVLSSANAASGDDGFGDVGECMDLRVPALEPLPDVVELERRFVEFDYIEFQRFRAYFERHGGISTDAAGCARAVAAQMADAIDVGSASDVPLECLTLGGVPVVRPITGSAAAATAAAAAEPLGSGSGGESRSSSIVSAIGLRHAQDPADAGRTARVTGRLVRRTTSTAIARLKGRRSRRAAQQAPPNPPPPGPSAQVPAVPVLQQPPSFVSIDPLTWTHMYPEQQNLARRYCTKMIHENQRLMTMIIQAQEENEEDDGLSDSDELFQSTYSLTAASLLPAARQAGKLRAKGRGVSSVLIEPPSTVSVASSSSRRSSSRGDPIQLTHMSLAQQRLACKSTPSLHSGLTKHKGPSMPSLHNELTRHGGLTKHNGPSMPSLHSGLSKHNGLTKHNGPSMPSLHNELTKHSGPSMSSLHGGHSKHNGLTKHNGPSTPSLHGRPVTRRFHAGSRASVTCPVPRLQPIAAGWPSVPKRSAEKHASPIRGRLVRSPSSPVSPTSDSEWDMLPEAIDRFGLSSAAAATAAAVAAASAPASCFPPRKRSV